MCEIKLTNIVWAILDWPQTEFAASDDFVETLHWRTLPPGP